MAQMINRFHISSQSELIKPIFRERHSKINTNELFHIGKDVDRLFNEFKARLSWTELEHRTDKLKRIYKSRQLILECPDNLWLVYELCKDIYELAEIDRVDFNGSSLSEKTVLVTMIVPFAKLEALQEGVIEYHLSRERENWTMHYLKSEGVKVETC